MSDIATLHSAIADMDLPSSRKTSEEIGDLRWLARNIGIRNAGHPRFGEAMIALKSLLKAHSS